MSRQRQLARLRRMEAWLRPQAILLAGFAVLVGAGLVGGVTGVDDACAAHAIPCGLAQNVVVTLWGAAIAYWWLVGRKRTLAFRHYAALLRDRPEHVLRAAGLDAVAIAGRVRLCTAITDQLQTGMKAEPVVVVGAAGAGRSALLPVLLRMCGRRRWLAVPVSLAEGEPVALLDRARAVFEEAAGAALRSSDEADVIWKRLLHSRRLVLLVDGIEAWHRRGRAAGRARTLARALSSAIEAGHDVVLFAEADAVPRDLDAAVFALPGISGKQARDMVAAGRGAAASESLRRLLEMEPSPVRDSVFLLRCAHDLALAGWTFAPIPDTPSKIPGWLLDAWAELQFETGTGDERRATLDVLGHVALAMIAGRREELGDEALRAELDALRPWLPPPSAGDLEEALDAGVEAGLVATDAAGVRFADRVAVAWLAGRALGNGSAAGGEALYRRLLERSQVSPALWDSLGFAAAGNGRRGSAMVIADALLARGRDADVPPARRLEALLAAVKVGLNAGTQQLVCAAADAAAEHFSFGRPGTPADLWRHDSEPERKLALLRALAEMDAAPTRRALFAFAHNQAFGTRWTAAHLLAGMPGACAAEFSPYVRATLDDAWSVARVADGRDRSLEFRVAVLGWTLPLLADAEGTGLLGELTDIALGRSRPGRPAPVANPLQIEVSLARGFKLAAMRDRPREPAPALLDLVDARPVYWYSRVSAAHALALSCRESWSAAVADRLQALSSQDPHPLVREAAALVLEASPPELGSVIWDVESDVIGSFGEHLTKPTRRLVADIGLLQNLLYAQSFERADVEKLAAADELPHCLRTSSDRRELFEACTCEFGMCPYPPPERRRTARGAFSEAFCRDQRRLARDLGRLPWQPNLAPRRLAQFWERLEREAVRGSARERLGL